MDMAQKNGMITLKQDGYIKALQGEIPIEEVYRVVQ
jgi:type II secretory ATPase GspE/PulE/Tfp pilus assembly ATPase PilB-like protein